MIKDKKDWTPQENFQVFKDTKLRNLMHNILDNVMSTVIACKNIKRNMEFLEVYCHRTQAIEKNMRYVLMQEYEYFEAKSK